MAKNFTLHCLGLIIVMLSILLSCKNKEHNQDDGNRILVNEASKDLVSPSLTVEEWANKHGFTFRPDRKNYLFQMDKSDEILDFQIFLEMPVSERLRINSLGLKALRFQNVDYSFFGKLNELNIHFCNETLFYGINNNPITSIVMFEVESPDLTGIAQCRDLKKIVIMGNKVSNIDDIKNCENLEVLSIYSQTPFSIPTDLSKLTKLKELAIGYNDMTDFSGIETIPSSFKFTVNSPESIRNASLEALGKANISTLVVHIDFYNAEKTKIDEVVAQQKERNPDFQLFLDDF